MHGRDPHAHRLNLAAAGLAPEKPAHTPQGPLAMEPITEVVVTRHPEATVEEMDRAMHPHLTLSGAVAEAALAGTGHAPPI